MQPGESQDTQEQSETDKAGRGKRRRASENGSSKHPSKEEDSTAGRWTKEEHKKFVEALNLYGKDWKKVQMHVGTRTTTQARSHAQKYFAKLEKSESSAGHQSKEPSSKGNESGDSSCGQSQVPTAISSPVCKSATEVSGSVVDEVATKVVVKTVPRSPGRRGKRVLPSVSEPAARKAKIVFDSQPLQLPDSVPSPATIQKPAAAAIPEEAPAEELFGFVQGPFMSVDLMSDYGNQPGEMVQMPRPASTDVEFVDLQPDPVLPLELSYTVQHTVEGNDAMHQEEPAVTTDFSDVNVLLKNDILA